MAFPAAQRDRKIARLCFCCGSVERWFASPEGLQWWRDPKLNGNRDAFEALTVLEEWYYNPYRGKEKWWKI